MTLKRGNEAIVKDIVCGMVKPISEMQAKSLYKGKVYYFCTPGDKELFEAYPDKWVPRKDK